MPDAVDLRTQQKLLRQQLVITEARCQRISKALQDRRGGGRRIEVPLHEGSNNNNNSTSVIHRPSSSILAHGPAAVIQHNQVSKAIGSATIAPALMIERRRQELLKNVSKEVEEHKRKEAALRRQQQSKGACKSIKQMKPNRAAIPRSFFPALYQVGTVGRVGR